MLISDEPPFPFIVGVGRSGTTLLRLMIDAHPEMVVTHETHWLLSTIGALEAGHDANVVHKHLLNQATWPDMGITDDELTDILAAGDPLHPGETLRNIYRCYADRHSVSRVGDKTPAHGSAMVEIERLLPEAHFIHIIRDGRDVAVSYRGLRFGPGNDAGDAAIFWKSHLTEIRRQGAKVRKYMEVRYESLIEDPETTLRQIGEFIGLPFNRRQLDSHMFAASRLSELKTVSRNGRTLAAEQRQEIHKLTLQKPDKSRVGRWRTAMAHSEIEAFDNAAGDLLAELGYR
jgi:hypothetical protein